MKKFLIVTLLFMAIGIFVSSFETITFNSKDGVKITADVYMAHPNTAPFIILYHQAASSRGEYREIAPELNRLGFNAMAIDQRAGYGMAGVENETVKRVEIKDDYPSYLDALPDMEAGVAYAKKHYASGKIILWGSSYSASLVLKMAGDDPAIADGVLAFSPGEYFTWVSSSLITETAKNITVPVFITSGKNEKDRWNSIYEAISSTKKTYFLPQSQGTHGSSALWKSTAGNEEYWQAVKQFLNQFLK
jgi:dienelactone hydrolase